jgi:hypothetical protein
VERKVESKNMVMVTRRTTSSTYKGNNVPSFNPPKHTRSTPQQMDERREKGLCFNCDSKYRRNRREYSHHILSCHALVGINTPQTLKIEGYIKNKKVIVLIDSGGTRNFIHCKLAKVLNCFIYPRLEFQVMITDGGPINCLGKYHNINLTMV